MVNVGGSCVTICLQGCTGLWAVSDSLGRALGPRAGKRQEREKPGKNSREPREQIGGNPRGSNNSQDNAVYIRRQ